MRSLLTHAATLAALSLLPAHAWAQQSTRETVGQQLTRAAAGAGAGGYRPAARVFDTRSVMGMLPGDGTVVFEANLRAGVRYTVVAVCDSACADLDLRIQSPGGEQVLDQDVSTDNVPVLTFTAEETGPHPLAVIMSECETAMCWFGVQVLAR